MLNVRVGAARSALEVLLDTTDETKRLVRAYGRLTRTAETAEATYKDVFWSRGAVQLTPDEWWLTRLSDLRNKITHGDVVNDDLWEHDGHHQLNHIHDRLIQALAIVIADNSGDALLSLPTRARERRRRVEEFDARLREAEGPARRLLRRLTAAWRGLSL